MNKRMMLWLLSCALPSMAWAAPPGKSLGAQVINRLTDAAICSTYEGDTSGFGKAMKKHCSAPQRKAQADFDRSANQRTLQDCIKPGNLIDDDVRKCMKGR